MNRCLLSRKDFAWQQCILAAEAAEERHYPRDSSIFQYRSGNPNSAVSGWLVVIHVERSPTASLRSFSSCDRPQPDSPFAVRPTPSPPNKVVTAFKVCQAINLNKKGELAICPTTVQLKNAQGWMNNKQCFEYSLLGSLFPSLFLLSCRY